MHDAMSYLTNSKQAVSRYIDAHLRLMEIESHPEQLAYTPEGARDFMRLKRRIEAARRKREALRLVLAQSEITREQILGVYEKHGLPLPNNYQELALDQLIRIARRDRNRLFEEISRLDARLSHSPLMAEADLLRHEIQEIRHSGMLRHGAQMPEIVSLDSELTPLQWWGRE